jgi:hypothetical protein
VVERMRELSAQYPRYGYRRIRIFLRRDGHRMSHEARHHHDHHHRCYEGWNNCGPGTEAHRTFRHGQGDGQTQVTLKLSRNFKCIWRTPLPPNGPSVFAPPLGYDMEAVTGTFRKRSVLLRRIRMVA